MKILSWNVAYRVRKQKDQLEGVISRTADVIGLQEVTTSTLPIWVEGFHKSGYPYTTSTFETSRDQSILIGPRKYGLLIASRWPLNLIDHRAVDIPWHERFLSVLVASPNIDFEFHTAHIPPGSSHSWLKIETFNGIYKFLCKKLNSDFRILCGDFNSPQAEFEDGAIITWGQDILDDNSIRLSDKYGKWDAGERSVIQGLADFNLHDIFRMLNGYKRQEYSWVVRRKGRVVSKRRFDHIFASKELNPVACNYIHSFRENSLSDHSAIEAKFDP